MKKLLSVLLFFVKPAAGLFIASVLFTACIKNDVANVRTPAAGLMAFNLAPDKLAVVYTLSGNQFGSVPLNYTNYTGVYLPVFVGNREVRSVDFNTGSTIALATENFADSIYYSVFLIGANGSYRNIVVKDELDSLSPVPGKAWVRYINAIPDSTSAVPMVTIGENSINEAASYASVSSFKQVTAGSINTAISNGLNISASRSIMLDENKIYTVLFVGIPSSTDSTKAIQVKFIQNGVAIP